MVLRSHSTVEVARPDLLLDDLCTHYAEHGDVSWEENTARVVVSFGEARLYVHEGALHVTAESPDETGLAYIKMGVAGHVLEFAPTPAPIISWQGDGAAGILPPFFRIMRVVKSRRITPHMQRLTLAGSDLSRFSTGGLHMRLVFPPRGREPVWPMMGNDGLPIWPQGDDQLTLRVYTIRAIDAEAGEIEVDMVLHPGANTPGASFAEMAEPGDVVGMSGPGGGFYPQTKKLLLLGDETALPAMARILENAGSDVQATAFIEVDSTLEEQAIETDAAADIRYLHRNGAEAGTTGMLTEAFLAHTADGLADDVYVWAGCEFEDFRAIRRHARQALGVDKSRHHIVAYWRRGTAGDEARKGARDID